MKKNNLPAETPPDGWWLSILIAEDEKKRNERKRERAETDERQQDRIWGSVDEDVWREE